MTIVKSYHICTNETTVIHELTFDYLFERVPRRFGHTQLRVDYSNQVVGSSSTSFVTSICSNFPRDTGTIWSRKPQVQRTKKKKKQSLEAMDGNHKGSLEQEFRDDMHFGGLSKEKLHKRWFGEDIVSWLRGLSNGGIKLTFRHD